MARRRRNPLVITSESTAEYTCVCGAAHSLHVDPELLRSSTPVRMRFRCPCGRRRVFFLERRSAVRKEVNLPGVLSLERGGGSRSIQIRNLSRNGALLELDGQDELAVGEGWCWSSSSSTPRPPVFASGPWFAGWVGSKWAPSSSAGSTTAFTTWPLPCTGPDRREPGDARE